jgi:predicted TIM-barrel fold metal-dependent hydrolase
MCHIRTALVACETYQEYDFDLLKPLWRLINFMSDKSILGYVRQSPGGPGKGIGGYLDWMEEDFHRYLKRGRVGIKGICFPFEAPDVGRADAIFNSLYSGAPDRGLTLTDRAILASVMYDRAFRLAQSHGLTVAMHSGVWGDFRQSQPTYLIPMATQYPGVRFDLFHLGMPFVREAVMIGKMFPNVSLNLCWNTVVSPELTVRMLDECLDMVALNRIIVFGADYNLPVEKVYGHLKMAKQVVARVLAKRIRRGEMDLPEAARIARMWFHDNAVSIYGL